MSDRRRFLQQSSLLIGGATLASSLNNSAFAIFNNRIAPSDQVILVLLVLTEWAGPM